MRKRTSTPRLALLALAVGLVAPGSVAAQDDGELPATFTSDRPGFANTTGVAARGRLTTELGVSGAFDDQAPSGSLPNLSLRVGLFDWLEARVLGPNAVGDFGGAEPTFGVGDPSVGFKVGGRLHESLAISSVWQVSLPIATDSFGAPEAELFADFNLDWNFWGPLTVTPNLVAAVLATIDEDTGETVRSFDGGGSLKLTWQILDVLGIFVQSYVLKAERPPRDWRVQVGGGLMWMVAPNIQVDASFDIGVTDGSDDPPTAGLGTTVLW